MQNLLPVAREAERRGLLGGIVSSGNFSKDLQEFGGRIPIVRANDLISQLGIRERRSIVGETVRVLRELSQMLSSYNPRLARGFLGNAGRMLGETIRSLEMAKAFGLLLDAWSPSCIVSTSDLWPLEYQIAGQACRKDIPSIVIQHGTLIYYYWPFAASSYVVWGQQSLEEMLGYGAPAERLMVGGMPASDTPFNRIPTEPAGQKGAGPPVCLILSHPLHMEPELYVNYKRFLSEVIPITPFVRWKVKLHPSEDRRFYDELAPEIKGKLAFHSKSTTLPEALAEADTVTTLYSTAGLEAMIAGHPLIIPLISPRMTEPGLLPQIKGGKFVHSPIEFKKELELLLASSEYRGRQLERQREALSDSFANQGHAAEAIVELIQSHLRSRLVDQTTGQVA
jgi:hypothetical protein